MKINTKNFGQIEVDDEKLIEFPNGIMGFENMKTFTLIFDAQKSDRKNVMWLQSLDEEGFAMPMVDPLAVCESYDPVVEDEILKCIGDFELEDLLILTTLTVPSDITKMSTNLKAPIIINTVTKKGCQVIVDNEEYEIKHFIYDYLKKAKGEE